MTTIKLNDSTARSIYPTADANLKKILVESFGAAFFSQKITDRIKTFEDACKEIGEPPATILHCDDTTDEAAYKKLKVIVNALNEGWKPDWNNTSEYKYYPWFEYKKGIGFVLPRLRLHHPGIRLSAPAFASKIENWQNTLRNSSNQFTTIF